MLADVDGNGKARRRLCLEQVGDHRGAFHLPPTADKTASGGYATKMTSARRP